jgi:hypothetical protein
MCKPPLSNRGLGMASLEKNGTQDPLEQTAGQALHILHLMYEEKFQPLFLTFIYFKRKPGLRSDQMAPKECDEPFGDWTQHPWPLLHISFYFPMRRRAVTLCLLSKDISTFANRKGLILVS